MSCFTLCHVDICLALSRMRFWGKSTFCWQPAKSWPCKIWIWGPSHKLCSENGRKVRLIYHSSSISPSAAGLHSEAGFGRSPGDPSKNHKCFRGENLTLFLQPGLERPSRNCSAPCISSLVGLVPTLCDTQSGVTLHRRFHPTSRVQMLFPCTFSVQERRVNLQGLRSDRQRACFLLALRESMVLGFCMAGFFLPSCNIGFWVPEQKLSALDGDQVLKSLATGRLKAVPGICEVGCCAANALSHVCHWPIW